jgi:hypothetical protein
MISEVIREADELEHFLLSRGLRKVKDLQSLLWGERGACRGDEVTDVFDLRETKLGFLGLDSDILSTKALKFSLDVTEELRFGFVVKETEACRFSRFILLLPINFPLTSVRNTSYVSSPLCIQTKFIGTVATKTVTMKLRKTQVGQELLRMSNWVP